MNREQRRKYAKQIKNDKTASICPECNHRTRFISTKKENEETALICECCGSIVRQNATLTKMVPPGIYLPCTLKMLDTIMKAEEEIANQEEARKDDTNEN